MNAVKEKWGQLCELYRKACRHLGDKDKPYCLPNLIAAFFASFCFVTAQFVRNAPTSYTEREYLNIIIVPMFLALIALVTMSLIVLSAFVRAERVLPVALVIGVTNFCCTLQKGGDRNIFIGVAAALLCYLTCVWIFKRFDRPFSLLKIGYAPAFSAVVGLFLLFTGYMSLMGVCRYYSFTYNTFDFGIFAQMFGYMKETGLPFTTVERGEALSHFAVHFSPFFYVLYPGYLLFSSPAYLCVMQTLFVGLGVFAVYGIAKHLGFSPKQTILASALYLLFPSMSYGLYLDFHENKFLSVCVLFAVYFMLRRKWIPFYISGLLLCSVKEDAAIYLIAIGLFMLFHEKLIKHGSVTVVLAFAYFAFAMWMITVCGAEEGMQFGYRYSNFELDGEAGVGSIVKITLLDFGYTLSQIFTQEKIEFMLWMFVPVLFTPFLSKNVSVLLLMTPMLLVNLMSNWPYQYDIDFQYTYGSAALVLACTLLVLAGLRRRRRNALLLAAVMLCVSLTVPRVIARNTSYIDGYMNNREKFHTAIDFIHETLPDKEVYIGVEGDVMPVMYDYLQLYLDPRSDELAQKLEFYVAKNYDSDIKEMTSRGFELYATDGYIEIYKNPHYVK